jgi:hypothetical protein
VKSAPVAVKVIRKLTPISISQSHLTDLTATIGEELVEVRDTQTSEYLEGTLEPDVNEPPETVVVATDGGRILTRAEEAGRGVHDPAWKETKVGCLETLTSQPSEVDPHPELPGCFTDQEAVGKLVREIKSIRTGVNETGSNRQDDAVSENPESLQQSLVSPAESVDDDSSIQEKSPKTTDAKRKKKKKDWRPKRRVRTCISSMCNSDEFGPKVAAEARRRRFFEAGRKAFLGDGLAWNWTLQMRWFPDFEPILDFVHPTTYVYEASRVVAENDEEAWLTCVRWLEQCWQGQVSAVIEELRKWQALHPSPPEEKVADGDGRAIVSRALTYLSNNESRMDYPRYRRLGLPVTSSMVESLIKEINYRVKGSEKSWNRPSGCEAILQVRTAVLCDDADRLSDYIMSRPGSPYYRRSTTKCASEANATAA